MKRIITLAVLAATLSACTAAPYGATETPSVSRDVVVSDEYRAGTHLYAGELSVPACEELSVIVQTNERNRDAVEANVIGKQKADCSVGAEKTAAKQIRFRAAANAGAKLRLKYNGTVMRVQLAPVPAAISASVNSGDTVKSGMTVTGTARGPWFFEGSFPIEVTDANGNPLGTSVATALEDAYVDAPVNFSATLAFGKSTTKEGMVVFKKDNPSGEAKNDDQLVIPVVFADAPVPALGKAFSLSAGEEAVFDGLTLRFVGVKSDSRCPVGVQCVQAGSVAVSVKRADPLPKDFSLVTPGKDTAEFSRKYSLKLVGVSPLPAGTSPSATFVFEKR